MGVLPFSQKFFYNPSNKYHNKKKRYFEASAYILFVRPGVAVVDKQTSVVIK